MFWRQNVGVQQIGDRFVKHGERGQPDVFVVKAPSGQLLGIECKREIGGKESQDQERWAKNLVACGGKSLVYRGNLEELKAFLGPELVFVKRTAMRQRVYPR